MAEKTPVQTKKTSAHTNRLSREKSPYLLQHAHNPVDWYPWGEEAFRAAREADKPVFLSVGYSTCHWCHVMERESFQDEEVARLMNEAFVSVKVDREERSDVDSLYMDVVQMLTGRGGWPMTVIMTPEKTPFFAATYLPKHSRPGLTGMLDLIPAVVKTWETRRRDVDASADQILSALRQSQQRGAGGKELSERELDEGFRQLSSTFDPDRGGFGSAPKFPTPHNLDFLLRYWRRTGEERALAMVEKTLEAMRLGGIYDHVGFGFHRYATDAAWRVPHFEKMLYDQAQLCLVYLDAYQATGKKVYAQTAKEVFHYVLRDMRDSGCAFLSAEDADSEGEEGRFYLWTREQLGRVLGDDAEPVTGLLGVTGGMSILRLERPLRDNGESSETMLWASARQKLFEAREQRVRPHRDDKILTDWNGLMIAALARGGQVLEIHTYTEAASQAADFLLEHMRGKDGRLLHRYRDGEAAIDGRLTDYAFLLLGLVELYQGSFEVRYLRAAVETADAMIDRFWDEEEGGFFTIPEDAVDLPVRQKSSGDSAIPSGNSAAMLALAKLSRLTGRTDLEEKAVRTGRVFSDLISRYPAAHTFLLTALDFLLGPTMEIVLAGDHQAEDTARLHGEILTPYLPNKVVVFKPKDDERREIEELAPYTASLEPKDGRPTVYICRDFACDLPITLISELREALGTTGEGIKTGSDMCSS